MSKRSDWIGAVIAALAMTTLAPGFAWSQSIWLPRDVERAVKIEFLKPDFEFGPGGTGWGFFTLGTSLSARLPLGSGVSFISQVPMAEVDAKTSTESNGHSEQLLGNIYLGIESHGSQFGELGVHLPTSGDNAPDARLVGLVSDVGRWESFYSKAVTIQAAVNVRESPAPHLVMGIRLSPALTIPTVGPGADPEIFGVYSGLIGYEARMLRVGGAVSGRVLLTEEGPPLSERMENQLEIHADFGAGKLRPGLDVHFPLGDLREISPLVLGINFAFIL